MPKRGLSTEGVLHEAEELICQKKYINLHVDSIVLYLYYPLYYIKIFIIYFEIIFNTVW